MIPLTTVIPVYNGEKYLPATLDSLARQILRPERVVVLDNCSTDGTRQVYEAFKHLGFEWRRIEPHVSAVENFNRALEYAATSEYLHLLTADDIILPELFEQLIPPLEDAAQSALAYSAYELIDENGLRLGDKMPTVCPVRVVPDGPPRFLSMREYLKRQTDLATILMPCVVMKTRRQPLKVAFSREAAQLFDCLFYGQWGSGCGRIVEIPRVLCQYRIHSGSTTAKNMRQIKDVVDEEWHVMRTIGALMPASRAGRWLRRQRSLCLLAARSHVKISRNVPPDPVFAAQIEETTRQYVSPLHWYLGGWAVKLRDIMRAKGKYAV